jgi:hypothetical protein
MLLHLVGVQRRRVAVTMSRMAVVERGVRSALGIHTGNITLRPFLPLAVGPSDSIRPSPINIHTEPYGQTGSD